MQRFLKIQRQAGKKKKLAAIIFWCSCSKPRVHFHRLWDLAWRLLCEYRATWELLVSLRITTWNTVSFYRYWKKVPLCADAGELPWSAYHGSGLVQLHTYLAWRILSTPRSGSARRLVEVKLRVILILLRSQGFVARFCWLLFAGPVQHRPVHPLFFIHPLFTTFFIFLKSLEMAALHINLNNWHATIKGGDQNKFLEWARWHPTWRYMHEELSLPEMVNEIGSWIKCRKQKIISILIILKVQGEEMRRMKGAYHGSVPSLEQCVVC